MFIRSADPLCSKDIQDVVDEHWRMQSFLITANGPKKKLGIFTEIQKNQIIKHSAYFIELFYSLFQKHPTLLMLHSSSLFVLKHWSDMTSLSRSIPSSHLYSILDSEFKNLFLGEGLCTGSVMQYFSQFFKNNSPIQSSPFPIKSPLESEREKITFYPFTLDEEFLQNETKNLRFLHAAYKISSAHKQIQSLEFMPPSMLKGLGLRLLKRIPEIQEPGKTTSFNITDIVILLKELVDNDKKDAGKKGYLLGLRGSVKHAIALHLKKPFHFVDPNYGIAIASDLESLVLFLVSYLTDKYSLCSYFAFLALEPESSN